MEHEDLWESKYRHENPVATSAVCIVDSSNYNQRCVTKTEYDLLLFQVAEFRKRLEEVEERERILIKMLMEKLDGADDKDAS